MQEAVIAVLSWIACALIGAMIGKNRSRAGAGFFWGLALGPLGWLVILFGPDLRLKCPECGGVVQQEFRRCKHCGVEIQWVD